ncbi:hypothetical protein ABFV99_13205 [Cytobacillus horneckiae]|uniref:hypothetical protein n=1 Tax=Cytobacillus horneckiae TaxID=549687 RepID=UPI0034CF8594
MEYIKLQAKIKKWIGKKAANTSESSLFGIPGVVEKFKIKPTNEEGTMFKLFFLINYGNHKLLSAEENTVIYLDR